MFAKHRQIYAVHINSTTSRDKIRASGSLSKIIEDNNSIQMKNVFEGTNNLVSPRKLI